MEIIKLFIKTFGISNHSYYQIVAQTDELLSS